MPKLAQRQITLSPGQSVFFNSPYKYTLASSGIGGGKSFVGNLRMINKVSQAPGSLNLVATQTYPMLRDSTYRTFKSLAPPGFIIDENRNDGWMLVRAGDGTAEILWRSLINYEFLRGVEFLYAYIDEMALIHPTAWKILKGRLRGKCPDNPLLKPQGWGTTTPRGKNWMWKEFVDTPTRRHAWVHWSGYDNEANLPEGYYEDLGYTGSFYDQEVLGLFAAFQGLVYDMFVDDQRLLNSHIRLPAEEMRFNDVVGGLDWGYIDPTAACVFGLYGDSKAWQLDEFYERKANFYDRVIPAVLALTKQHGVSVWYCDSSEPDKIDELRRAADKADVDTQFRAVEKGPGSITSGIQTVQWLLQERADGSRGLLVSPTCTNTIKEYLTYQYSTKEKVDRAADELPMDTNNHAQDASRYALHSVYGQRRHSGNSGIAVATSMPRYSSQLDALLHRTQKDEDDLDEEPIDPRTAKLLDEREERDVRRRAQNARIADQLRQLGGFGW